jgi:hypothetical protein
MKIQERFKFVRVYKLFRMFIYMLLFAIGYMVAADYITSVPIILILIFILACALWVL